MAQTITRRTTVRQRRSILGYFTILLFLLVNLFCGRSFVLAVWHWMNGTPFANGNAATTRSALAALLAWVVGAAIFYVPVYMTRGRKEIIEVEEMRTDNGVAPTDQRSRMRSMFRKYVHVYVAKYYAYSLDVCSR